MGGNALKQYDTRRYEKEEYRILTNEVINQLYSLGIFAYAIPSYKNKETYGDLDIIIETDGLSPTWVDDVIQLFSLAPNQWVKNSNVLSIGYKNFQVDLITIESKYLASSLQYYSYNDLGNLMGRLGHKLGIKYGHKGLSLVVRQKDRSDHILKEIELNSSLGDIFDILGLDFNKFLTGFDDLEDIFKFVASSKFFDPDIYLLDNRNATSRVRDKKRQTYTKFLEWCDQTKPIANYHFDRKSELGGYSLRMPYYKDIVLTRWPEVEQEVNELIANFEFEQKFKEVYNGTILSSYLGIEGKELGTVMQRLRPFLSREIKEHMISNPATLIHFLKFTMANS